MTQFTPAALWERLTTGGRADLLVLAEARISYAEFALGVRRWMQRFDAAGLHAGDRVIIRTANEPASISCFVAALLDGLVPVNLTSDTPDLRARGVIDAVAAGCVVVDSGQELAALPPSVHPIVLRGRSSGRKSWFAKQPDIDPLTGLAGTMADRPPRLPAADAGLAYILFTSGTTASPSGVMITRANLFANLATMSRLFGYGAQARIFNDMILAHADGMIQGPLIALANGGAVIRSGGFALGEIEPWLERVRSERATHVITVPTVWAMIDAYAAHDDYFDAPECRALLSVAARLPDELWARIEQRFKRPVMNQYGLTETVASALYAGPWPEMGGFGTIGKPVDCEARIDPAAATPGEGELHLRGTNIFAGYWQNEARTQASFTSDGWMKTGDLARLGEDGSYAILGRIKSVIMMGGFLIRPDEIDEAMLSHPAIRESVTVAVDDAMFGEVPVTAVVCDPSQDELGLTRHARERLESQKVPKRIIALEAIPRGISGKPNLPALLALIGQALGERHVAQPADTGVGDAVLAIAADVFRVPSGMLTLESKPGDIAGWDSFSQLNFVMAVETQFGIEIPAARFAAIKSISDMVRAVRDLVC